jgi:hypothetical protein
MVTMVVTKIPLATTIHQEHQIHGKLPTSILSKLTIILCLFSFSPFKGLIHLPLLVQLCRDGMVVMIKIPLAG